MNLRALTSFANVSFLLLCMVACSTALTAEAFTVDITYSESGTCVNGKKTLHCKQCGIEATVEMAGESATDAEKKACKDKLPKAGSLIDNLSLNHIHTATDWSCAKGSSGCSSCSGGVASAPTQADLRRLHLERTHRFRDMTDVSSFGPGIFQAYDISFGIQYLNGGTHIRLFDPEINTPLYLDDGLYGDTLDGIFHDGMNPQVGDRTVADLRLMTGVWGAGSPTAIPASAQSAVLNCMGGKKLVFDLINLGPAFGIPVVGIDTWKSVDVGYTGFGGGAAVTNDAMIMGGGGADVWWTTDACQYVYQALQGDGDVTYRLDALKSVVEWTKTGPMARQNLSPGSPMAMMMMTGAYGLAFQYRSTQDGTCTGVYSGNYPQTGGTEPRVAKVDPATIPAANTDMTEAFWIRLDQGFTGKWRSLMHKGNNDKERSFAIQMRPESNRLHYRFSTLKNYNEGGSSSVAELAVGTWTHVAVVKQGSKVSLYLNGVLDSSATLSAQVASNDGPLYIGKDPWYDGVPSSLDDLLLYSRALTVAEVVSLAQVGSGDPVVSTDGLVARWGFNEGAGILAADETNAAQTGTLSGTTPPTWTTGVHGGGIAFSGTNWVQVASSPALSALCDDPNLVRITKVRAPVWMRVQRVGNVFTGQASLDGSYWSTVGSCTLGLGQDIYIGTALTAHQFAARAQAFSSAPVLHGTPTPEGSWPPTGVPCDLRGRLAQIVDRNGYVINLAYRYNPAWHPASTSDQRLAIGQDPDLQWQLAGASDPMGNVLAYNYLPTQVAGRWVVSSVTVPNGSSVNYVYDSTRLTEVRHADGTASTFGVSVDPPSNTTVIQYRDAAAEGIHRNKTVYLTSNFTQLVHGSYESVYNQASMLIRQLYNADGERVYAAISVGNGTDLYIYENGMMRYQAFTWSRYYLPGWTLTPTGVVGQLEYSNESEDLGGDWNNFHRSTPVGFRDANGAYQNYTYDPDHLPTSVKYADGSTTSRQYNAFKQSTRIKDRLGQVEARAFDANGNLLSRTTGLRDAGGTDQTTPETATESTEYFPAGHPQQFLRSAQIDAGGNRTDYVYDAAHRLVEVISPADVSGGPRPVTRYAYDSAGRLASSTNPLNQTITYAYDLRDRISRISYADGSHEDMTYGTGIDANLLVAKRDRNGVVTTYAYDNSGRRISTITGSGAAQRIETATYVPSGELVATRTVNNTTTRYAYDFKNRLIDVEVQPTTTGPVLASRTFYVGENQWCTLDPYGRATYHIHDQFNREIRTVRELVVNGTGCAPDVHGFSSDVAMTIRSALSGMALDIPGSTGAEGAAIVQYGFSGSTNQRWSFVSNGDGSWRIQSLLNGKVLTVNGATPSLLTQNSWTGATSQRFTIQDTDSGTMRILSVATGKALEVLGGATTALANITQAVVSNNPAQQWWAIPLAGGVKTAALARVTPVSPSYALPYVIEESSYNAEGQMIARIDACGVSSSYNYDSRGRVVSEIRADKKAGVILPEGTRTEYQYDVRGNQTKVIHPRSFVRKADGTFAPSELGEVTTKSCYTGRNLLASTTGADRATVSWTYSATGKKLTETRQLEATRYATTTFIYGGCCDRLWKVRDALGFETIYGYDNEGQVTSATDPNGNPTTTVYDALRRVKTSSNAENEVTRYDYDDDLTDGQGIEAEYPFLVAGLGFGPGAAGSAVKMTDPMNGVVIQIRDSLGRTLRSRDANGLVSFVAHDMVEEGLVAVIATDPLGHSNKSRVDADGLTRIAWDAENRATTLAYDACGNQVSRRDPNAIGFDAVFDGQHREVQRTDTAGAQGIKEYDAHGNVVRQRDALLKWSSATFDRCDRKVTETDRNNHTTLFTYDLGGRLIGIEDAEHQVTSYVYDDVGRLVQEVYPPGQATPGAGEDRRIYAYDGAGRLLTRLDQSGVLTRYAYDHANRLLFRRYPDGRDDAFTYDDAGRLTSATSTRYGSDVARQYDGGGRLLIETQTIDDVPYSVRYGYKEDSTVATIAYPNGQRVFRSYTPRHQLEQVWYGADADAASSVALRAYDLGGRLVTTALANGLTETRTYTPNDNTVKTIVVPGVTSFTYGFDANKRKTGETGTDNQSFSYDDADRLTAWTGADSTRKAWDLSPVGDWNKLTTTQGLATTEETRSHSDVHETTGINRGSGVLSLTYDARGNLTRDEQGQAYAWDVENRLASARVHKPDQGCTVVALYRYDALGRRIQKIVGGIATTFIHDGAQVIQELGGTAAWSPSSTTSSQSALPATASPDQATTKGQILDDVLVKVNWQPSGAVPEGYVGDTGVAKPEGSDPYLFGWASAPTDATRRNAEMLPELDTSIKATASSWQINLPDGSYPIVMFLGDPMVPVGETQFNNVAIAGQNFTDADPYPASSSSYGRRGDFDGYFTQATVSGGILSIAPGAGAQNARFCFLEIGPRGPLTDAQVAAIQAKLTNFLTKAKARTAQAPITPASGKVYVYGSYVDEPLMIISGAVKLHAHANYLYSVAALTTADGVVQERYRYDGYGKRTILTAMNIVKAGAALTTVAFTGRTVDDETGLMYFRSRQYSLEQGRFAGRDIWKKSENKFALINDVNVPAPSSMDGYGDGANLYSAYFAPDALDPSGKKMVGTGVKSCDGYVFLFRSKYLTIRQFAHAYLTIDGRPFGYWGDGSNNGFWDRGIVGGGDDTAYPEVGSADEANKKGLTAFAFCDEVMLDDCCYDIEKFKIFALNFCLASEAASKEGRLIYNALTSNCIAWRNSVITHAKNYARRPLAMYCYDQYLFE